MRVSSVKIVLFLFLAFLVSCKVEIPEDVLPPEKMEAVLYDYHLIQSMASTYASVDYKEKLMFTYLYDKHNISKEQLDSSLVWYNRYPKHIKGIYDNLEARFQHDVDVLGGAKAQFIEGVDLEIANLALEVAELWTGHPVKMLLSVPLNNKLQFSFNAPKDSTFVAGDSLVFSFKAAFLSDANSGVKQEAYAAIAVEYNDESYCTKGVSIKEAGDYVIPVSRNYGSRLKSMSGYVYYFDNDTAGASKVLLSELSVKRLHPAESTKTNAQK